MAAMGLDVMCPHMADEANIGMKAIPRGLAPVGGVHVCSI